MKRAVLILAGLFVVHSALAIDPPPLERADAKRIMEAMTWTDVNIIAIRQGVDANGAVAPIYATVVGLGKFCGVHRSIAQTVYYDKELDWYILQLNEKSARVWSKNGVQEIKPWALW